MLYTYNGYLRDLLKDQPCVLAYDTAAEYRGLSNGFLTHDPAQIFVMVPLNIKDTEEFLVPTFRYIAYEKKGGLYCTTVNQTINDLLRADGDNQVIQEALANYYDMYGESFDGLTIDADLIPRFNRYKEWALEYYTEVI